MFCKADVYFLLFCNIPQGMISWWFGSPTWPDLLAIFYQHLLKVEKHWKLFIHVIFNNLVSQSNDLDMAFKSVTRSGPIWHILGLLWKIGYITLQCQKFACCTLLVWCCLIHGHFLEWKQYYLHSLGFCNILECASNLILFLMV